MQTFAVASHRPPSQEGNAPIERKYWYPLVHLYASQQALCLKGPKSTSRISSGLICTNSENGQLSDAKAQPLLRILFDALQDQISAVLHITVLQLRGKKQSTVCFCIFVFGAQHVLQNFRAARRDTNHVDGMQSSFSHL